MCILATKAGREREREGERERDRGRERERERDVAETISNEVPPCVKHAVWSTWLNGWTTARRFQQRGSVCVLCHEGEDSIEHYAVCDVQWKAFNCEYPFVIDGTFNNFMLAGSLDGEELIALACHMYAVKTATNIARASKEQWSKERATKEVRAGHKTCCRIMISIAAKKACAWKNAKQGEATPVERKRGCSEGGGPPGLKALKVSMCES